MASTKFTVPFVVTVATVSMACGTVTIEGGGDGGNGGQGGGTTSGSNGSNGGLGGSNPPFPEPCPLQAPGPYESCGGLYEPEICSYQVVCQSSVQTLEFECVDNYWKMVPNPCSEPHDSCAGTQYYCDDTWWMPEGTNPPGPCPDSRPTAGAECFAGGMGGVWSKCGYRCDDTPGSPWTIATCPTDEFPGAWEYDNACDP